MSSIEIASMWRDVARGPASIGSKPASDTNGATAALASASLPVQNTVTGSPNIGGFIPIWFTGIVLNAATTRAPGAFRAISSAGRCVGREQHSAEVRLHRIDALKHDLPLQRPRLFQCIVDLCPLWGEEDDVAECGCLGGCSQPGAPSKRFCYCAHLVRLKRIAEKHVVSFVCPKPAEPCAHVSRSDDADVHMCLALWWMSCGCSNGLRVCQRSNCVPRRLVKFVSWPGEADGAGVSRHRIARGHKDVPGGHGASLLLAIRCPDLPQRAVLGIYRSDGADYSCASGGLECPLGMENVARPMVPTPGTPAEACHLFIVRTCSVNIST